MPVFTGNGVPVCGSVDERGPDCRRAVNRGNDGKDTANAGFQRSATAQLDHGVGAIPKSQMSRTPVTVKKPTVSETVITAESHRTIRHYLSELAETVSA